MPDHLRKKNGQSTAVVTEERRQHPRFPLSATGEMIDTRSGTRINGRASDLSRGGCYMDCVSVFPIGTGVKVRIAQQNKVFTARATIVSSDGLGMGVMFTTLEPEQICVLEQWVADLNAASRNEFEPLPEENHNGNGTMLVPGKSYILSELIISLMRKQVLTEEEGKAFLQKLLFDNHR